MRCLIRQSVAIEEIVNNDDVARRFKRRATQPAV